MNEKTIKIFENIYRDNADALFRFASYRVGDREQAIDIVEDAFLRFWESLQKEPVTQPRALLYRITRNLIIDWYKKKKSIPLHSFAGESEDKSEIYLDMFEGKATDAEILSEARIIKEAIRELGPIYREAVYLRYVEELSPTEIAEILGESSNVISVRINRGLKILKNNMKKNKLKK